MRFLREISAWDRSRESFWLCFCSPRGWGRLRGIFSASIDPKLSHVNNKTLPVLRGFEIDLNLAAVRIARAGLLRPRTFLHTGASLRAVLSCLCYSSSGNLIAKPNLWSRCSKLLPGFILIKGGWDYQARLQGVTGWKRSAFQWAQDIDSYWRIVTQRLL